MRPYLGDGDPAEYGGRLHDGTWWHHVPYEGIRYVRRTPFTWVSKEAGKMNVLARIRKALVAGIGAGVAAYMSAVTSGTVDVNTYITVVGSVIVIGVITYFVPNAPTPKPVSWPKTTAEIDESFKR